MIKTWKAVFIDINIFLTDPLLIKTPLRLLILDTFVGPPPTYLALKSTEKNNRSYRGWLGQHGPCGNTSARPSFLNTGSSFSKSRPSFWFSLKASKTSVECLKSSTERLKGSALCSETRTQPSVSLKSFYENLVCKKHRILIGVCVINLFNLNFIKNTCSYSLRQKTSYIPICWKKKKCREKRKRFKVNGKFQNWKLISEALLRVQGSY